MVMHVSLPSRSARHGRKPGAFVIRELSSTDAVAPVDWSAWYLTDEEDMGEGAEQGECIRALVSSGNQLAEERGWKGFYLGADQFFAWVRREPLVRVSPDVYLIDDPPPAPFPKMWSTWLPGHNPPRWAVEIVSDDWKKDYEDAPLKYAQLGTRELVIFDPEAALSGDRRDVRVALQVYRRDEDGAFVRVYGGKGPARSEEIDAYLVVRREGETVRLRIARDARGVDLVPTADEAKQRAEAAKQQAEAAKQQAEAAKQQAEAAKQQAEAAKQQAEAAKQQAEDRATAAEERARTLEAELARMRGGK